MIPPLLIPYSLAAGPRLGVAGAAFDLRSRRIPDRLTGAAVLVAYGISLWRGGVRVLLSVYLLAGGAFAIMFLMGGMASGDVKLMAAAAFAGVGHLLQLLVVTALGGGVLALAVSLLRGASGETLRGIFGWFHPRRVLTVHAFQSVPLYGPYGVSIAIGALFTFYSEGHAL